MKKIKNIKDIQVQKMQLRIRQLEQEKSLKKNWKDLKENFNLDMLTEKKIPESINKETIKDLLIFNGINFGAGLLSRRLTEIAGRKLENSMQKGVEKIASKLKARVRKKTEKG